MGGNALKNIKTDRINTIDYLKIKDELTKILNENDFNIKEYYFIKSYTKKDSHGDIDIIFFYDEYPQNILNDIKTVFKPNEIHKNDNAFSFDFKSDTKIVQVDIILYNINYIDTVKLFHNYNDLGNLIGRLAKMIGLKLSPKGLMMDIVYNNIVLMKNYNISNSIHDILNILNIDYNLYNKGFDSIDSMYDLIVTSQYFNVNSYTQSKNDLQNSKQRTRDNKRKTFVYFENEFLLKYPDLIHKNKIKKFNCNQTLELIKNFNPDVYKNLIQKQNELINKYKLAKQAHDKFNGNIIIDMLNIEPKLLNKYFKNFNDNFKNNDDKIQFILNNDINTIIQKFNDVNTTLVYKESL